jgi:hypothetical protein
MILAEAGPLAREFRQQYTEFSERAKEPNWGFAGVRGLDYDSSMIGMIPFSGGVAR